MTVAPVVDYAASARGILMSVATVSLSKQLRAPTVDKKRKKVLFPVFLLTHKEASSMCSEHLRARNLRSVQILESE
eukprot:9114013-Pyramimonas_sp.AAC.1